MLVDGLKVSKLVLERCNIKLDQFTKDNGKITYLKERASIQTKPVTFTLEALKEVSIMVREQSNMLMEISMRGNGSLGKRKVKVFIHSKMEIIMMELG